MYSILPPGAISAVSVRSAVVSVISVLIVDDVPVPFNTGFFIVQFINAEPFVESFNAVFIADSWSETDTLSAKPVFEALEIVSLYVIIPFA